MNSLVLFFLKGKNILAFVAFIGMLFSAMPAKAGTDDGLFLEILELFAKGAGMLGGDSMANAGSAIGAAACWYCPVFEIIFDVMNILATSVANKLSGVFLILLGVGTLFFLLFRIGKMLVGFQEVDLMQFLADIFKYLGRVMVASVLLTFSLSIFYHLISPVLQGTLTLGNIIYTQGASANMKIVKLTRDASDGKIDLTVRCDEAAKQANTQSTSDEKAFSPGVKEALLCNMRQVAASLVSGMASGIFTFFYGQTAGPLYLISPLTMLQGLILFLIFFLIFISYPFKLLDAMFQLVFVTALAPLWIVLWAFPATAGYAKKAWEVFFGACLTFFMVNVLAGLVLTILDMYAFPDSFWTDLIDGDMDGVANQFSLGGFEFLTLTAMGVLCLKILGTGKNLSSAFGGVSLDLGINQSAPSTAVSVVSSGMKASKTMGRLGDVAMAGLSKWGVTTGKMAGLKAASLGRFSDGKSGKGSKGSVSGWTPQNGPKEISGSIKEVHPDGMTVRYMGDNGHVWTSVYDEEGLKERHVTRDVYADGHAKTVDVYDSNNHLIGQRTYAEYNHENWTQKNTDGSSAIHTVEKNKDGSIEEITDNYDKDGHKGVYERRKTKTITDENGLEMTKRETWKTDRKTGEQTKRTETGETDEFGNFRVWDQTDERYEIKQGKQEKGSGYKVERKATFTYDNVGRLQTRKTYDDKGHLQNTRYYTDSGDKGDGSYTFGFRDYAIGSDGKPVAVGNPKMYHIDGRMP